MAAELPRPGVEVVQVISTVTPSVVTPTLVPCVIGVARQVVDLLTPDGTGTNQLNTSALVQLPAFIQALAATGSVPVYSGLDGLELVVSVDNGPNVTVLFSDPTASGLSPATVVSQVTAALAAAGVTSALAETISATQWRLRTLATGQFESLFVDPTTSGAVLTTFGIGAGKTYEGVGGYQNYETTIPITNFPDPAGNLSELIIEPVSVRVFLAMASTNFIEASRTVAFLRNGSVGIAAAVTGTVDLTTLTLPTNVQTLTLIVAVDGGTPQSITLTTASSTVPNLLVEINAHLTGAVATADATTHHLIITSNSLGAAGTILIGAGTVNSVLGFTTNETNTGTSVAVIDDGNGDNFSPLLQFSGYNFTSAPTAAVVTGNVSLVGLTYPSDLANKTLVISDGQSPQTVTFSSSVANEAAVLLAINAVLGTATGGRITATASGGNFLVLTSSKLGADSLVQIVGGTAVTTLGLTVGFTPGALGVVMAGDELFIEGVSIGLVSQVAPGGQTNVLKINSQQAISPNIGQHWYIMAHGLTNTGSRPTAQLVVDTTGAPTVKYGVLRDTNGNLVDPMQAKAPLYVSYTAIRKDLTASAKNPGLINIDSQTTLESVMSPITVQNPLALGLFFALVNAPGVQITGIGVDEVTADSPFGTVEAYNRAAEFLESYEVYALAPLTSDQTVAQVFNTHVSFMSEPENKGERIVLFNPEQPTNLLDTLVASGVNGNGAGSSGLQFDTGIPNLSALLLNKSVNPVGTIPTTAGVYLDIAADDNAYSISAISGSIVTIRTTFAAQDNIDDFYATTALNIPPLPSLLIQETFAIRIRGAALVLTDGTPDKPNIASTYSALSQSFGNRRFWNTMPDQAAATISGIEQVINGFYMNAAIAGMIGQQPPQQSFTNFPMTGFTRVIGSNQYFSESQLNIMAAGGTYIIVQDTVAAPLIARMALTTDMTSVESRTDSITKVVDFTAKFLRRGLKNFIGRFNITQAFLDQLTTVIGGLGGYLVEVGVLIGFNLNNLVQDEDNPDTVLVDVLLDPPYPCNYIRLTLTI